ncbi:MAG: tRNA epoxyqueuosine(34) reductase QueG [Leptospirillia bacterium]
MSASPDTVAAAIRERATALGLLNVGFVRPDLGTEGKRLSTWLEQGYAGDMAYIGRRRHDRVDPGRLLAGFNTAIVVSETYANPTERTKKPFTEMADPGRGYIARYARGSDYHDRLLARLNTLAETVTSLVPGAATRPYVDTGPILEKAWGQQAGLGWRGKHTNLVDPEGGNWICLGVILTDLELPISNPAPDRCGTCTDCMDACPTDAFPAPYVLDARRCISYLTIELKGAIPQPFRPAIGNRIFGCDDCLAACPWNRFARHARDTAYAGRRITNGARLTELMALTPEDFNRHFKNTPLHRTKRRGLLRNVAVALGNSGDPDTVPVLADAVADAEPLIRGHAAWALGEIAAKTGSQDAVHALADAAREEADAYVKAEISDARGMAAGARCSTTD